MSQKVEEHFNLKANGASINYSMIIRLLANSMRIEISNTQWQKWQELLIVGEVAKALNPMLSDTVFTLPVALNDEMPDDEMWTVSRDGKVVSKITGLAT